MHDLVTGGGQIAQQLVQDLEARGRTVVVLRREDRPVGSARVITGDAGDRDLLREAAAGASAIYHCVHAPYTAKAWAEQLPRREAAVMDVAAERGIPAIFPESVYAFGRGVGDLTEASPIAPVSPLGRVRAGLLAARAAHPARTASVVASDLVGPTASLTGSVIMQTLAAPIQAGRTAWVMGDPDAPHAVTFIPDLTRAMIAAAGLAAAARQGDDAVWLAPTTNARTQREMAADLARAAHRPTPAVRRLPAAALAVVGWFAPMARELHRQLYLFNEPVRLAPGRLSVAEGLEPTPWERVVRETMLRVSEVSPAGPAA